MFNTTAIRSALNSKPARSAWDRGVNAYANDLLDGLADDIAYGFFSADDLTTAEQLKKALLNGAADWKTYSWGGSALIYDEDIARRLCTDSELVKTRNGSRKPNKSEEWLDVQARALYQACWRILGCFAEVSV